MRIKLVKDSQYGQVGSIVVMDKRKALGLIDKGLAILTKDMTSRDYKVTSDEEVKQADGNITKLRPYHQS